LWESVGGGGVEVAVGGRGGGIGVHADVEIELLICLRRFIGAVAWVLLACDMAEGCCCLAMFLGLKGRDDPAVVLSMSRGIGVMDWGDVLDFVGGRIGWEGGGRGKWIDGPRHVVLGCR